MLPGTGTRKRSVRMRRLLLALAFLALASPGWATLGYDTFSTNGISEDDPSWLHTPVGDPRAAIVLCRGTAVPSSMTYGGTSLTLSPSGGTADIGTGELTGAILSAWHLGASISTGAQTVAVTTPSTATAYCHCVTVTGAADTEVSDDDNTVGSTSETNPSVTLEVDSKTSFAVILFASGKNAVTDLTPFTNWTDRDEMDFGSQTRAMYTYDIIANSDITAGWTQATEDGLMIAIAVAELASAAPSQLMLMGVGD